MGASHRLDHGDGRHIGEGEFGDLRFGSIPDGCDLRQQLPHGIGCVQGVGAEARDREEFDTPVVQHPTSDVRHHRLDRAHGAEDGASHRHVVRQWRTQVPQVVRQVEPHTRCSRCPLRKASVGEIGDLGKALLRTVEPAQDV